MNDIAMFYLVTGISMSITGFFVWRNAIKKNDITYFCAHEKKSSQSSH